MSEPLDHISTEQLLIELLKRNKDSVDKRTDEILERHKIKPHIGKGVVLWANDVMVMLEALNGNRQDMTQTMIYDTIHFEDYQNPVSLLDSALADVKNTVKYLSDDINTLSDLKHDQEVVHAVTLSTIHDIITDTQGDYGVDLSEQLTKDETHAFINDILGQPIHAMRNDMAPSFAPKLSQLIKKHVENETIKRIEQKTIKME